MKTEKQTDPLSNMKSIFIFTDIVIPAIASAIVCWIGFDLLDKWEEKRNTKKFKRFGGLR